jgi:hypothetical protein
VAISANRGRRAAPPQRAAAAAAARARARARAGGGWRPPPTVGVLLLVARAL